MLSVEEDNSVWPPLPIPAYKPPAKPPVFRWVLDRIGPLIVGIMGLNGGSILFSIVFLRITHALKDDDLIFAQAAISILGAVVGFICGVGAWFIGKAVRCWWMRRRERMISRG